MQLILINFYTMKLDNEFALCRRNSHSCTLLTIEKRKIVEETLKTRKIPYRTEGNMELSKKHLSRQTESRGRIPQRKSNRKREEEYEIHWIGDRLLICGTKDISKIEPKSKHTNNTWDMTY